MKKNLYTEDSLRDAIGNSFSWAEVFRNLNIKITGSRHSRMKLDADKWKIKYSHFTGQAHLRGKKNPWSNSKPIEEYLVENCNTNRNHLRNRLLREGIKEHKCEKCGRTHWEGDPIPLEMHHENGINNDNRLENIKLLCPNCHAKTDNYRGRKNRKYTEEEYKERRRKKQQERAIKKAKLEGREFKARGTKVPSDQKYCLDCSTNIDRQAVRCRSCASSLQPTKIDWPEPSEVLRMVRTTSLAQTGRNLGVAGNTVRKYLQKHSLL